jgi:hypothetical protein
MAGLLRGRGERVARVASRQTPTESVGGFSGWIDKNERVDESRRIGLC